MINSNKNIPKVYIAGPLYNEGERWILEKVDNLCRRIGFDTYLPHRDGGLCPATGEGGEYYFIEDKKKLAESELVVAILNGSSIDSGTAWELGYAYSRGCYLLGFFDDTRIAFPEANINLMIYYSVNLCSSWEVLKEKLQALFLDITMKEEKNG